ncbi:NlpC/P60 family protein [Actinomyces radicidentis]|uniref:C40 family peptidase n=1 Tax=Actinomyces radicidentis TaxID=111015 RepID=UPI0036F2D13B
MPSRTRLDRGTARTSALVAAVALAATLTPVAAADPVSQDDIDQAKANEATTSSSIADLEAQIAQLSVDSDNAQVAAQTANEDYLTALDELDAATADAATAQTNADEAAKKTEAARSDLGQVVVQTYQDGDGALNALTPYLSTDSWGDVSDNDVALTRAGENTDAEVQKVEALQAVADTMQSIADQKVSEKKTAADDAAVAKTKAETAATNAETAVTTAETERSSLITKLAEQRNTTTELETKYQDQLEAERKAREEAAAKAAAEKAAQTQAAKDEVAKAQEAAKDGQIAESEATPSASAAPAEQAAQEAAAEPTEEATQEPTTDADADAQASAEADAKATADAEAAAAAEAQRKAEEEAAAQAAAQKAAEEKAAEEQAAAEAAAQAAAEQQAAAEAAAQAAASANKADTAISAAQSYLGVPYVWAGESYSGLDCSGLTMLAYQQAGVYLTHSSRVQYGQGTAVPLSEAQPGDLIFWSHNGTQAGIYHVAIYLGDGQVIEAPNVGMTVRITSLSYGGGIMPYAVRP